MLSRYRSVSGLALPQGFRSARTNNPVQQFADTVAFRHERLRERAEYVAWDHASEVLGERLGHGYDDDGVRGAAGVGPLATAFRLWDGPMAGVAHQAGQFPGLLEGPAGEDVQQPPPELAQALASDLDRLAGLAETTQDIVYDAGGSESDFAVVPIMLEPRPVTAAAAAAAATAAEAAAAAAAEVEWRSAAPAGSVIEAGGVAGREGDESGLGAGAGLPGGHEVGGEAAGVGGCTWTGSGGSSGRESGASGGRVGPWWSVAEAKAAPLTWSEVAASLGIAPGLAGRMQPPLEFINEDAFWSHMLERHIAKLDGGDLVVSQSQSQQGRMQERQHSHPDQRQRQMDPEGGLYEPQGAPGNAAAASSAEAMATAVRRLMRSIEYPAFQVMVGSEGLGWNPIPLMWVARSRRSGAIVGLMTAVVWT